MLNQHIYKYKFLSNLKKADIHTNFKSILLITASELE